MGSPERWVQKYEGPDKDFIIYHNAGYLYFFILSDQDVYSGEDYGITSLPIGRQAVRLWYTGGHSSVPGIIESIACHITSMLSLMARSGWMSADLPTSIASLAKFSEGDLEVEFKKKASTLVYADRITQLGKQIDMLMNIARGEYGRNNFKYAVV